MVDWAIIGEGTIVQFNFQQSRLTNFLVWIIYDPFRFANNSFSKI